MFLEVKEITVKTILTPYHILGIDYVIDPYWGCSFGCSYCYASITGKQVDKSINDWGKYVFAKINAPLILKKEINKLSNHGLGTNLFLSLATDCYQGIEAKYQLTRQILQVLLDSNFSGTISVLTKSPLVLRDVGLFKRLKNVAVGLTVTSLDKKATNSFEKYAPSVINRLKTLHSLNKQNVKTYVFIGPVLPYFVDNRQELEKIFYIVKQVGTNDIFLEYFDLSDYIKERLFNNRVLKKEFDCYSRTGYKDNLEETVKKIAQKYHMNYCFLKPSFIHNYMLQ